MCSCHSTHLYDDWLQINFVNVGEGRLITRLLAQFDVKPIAGELLIKPITW